MLEMPEYTMMKGIAINDQNSGYVHPCYAQTPPMLSFGHVVNASKSSLILSIILVVHIIVWVARNERVVKSLIGSDTFGRIAFHQALQELDGFLLVLFELFLGRSLVAS